MEGIHLRNRLRQNLEASGLIHVSMIHCQLCLSTFLGNAVLHIRLSIMQLFFFIEQQEADSGEKLRIAKNNLEILNEKLTVQLKEAIKRLNLAENTGSQLDETDRKIWKSVAVARYGLKLFFSSQILSKNTHLYFHNFSFLRQCLLSDSINSL